MSTAVKVNSIVGFWLKALTISKSDSIESKIFVFIMTSVLSGNSFNYVKKLKL